MPSPCGKHVSGWKASGRPAGRSGGRAHGVVFNPRAYDNVVFAMISGNDNLAFRQNAIHGGQPIAQLYSSTKV